MQKLESQHRFAATFGTYLLLTTALLAICESRAVAMVQPNNVIHVWSVGSPFSGAIPQTSVPADLEQQAQNLGYTIEVQNFRAAGFASIFHEAVAAHTEPEFMTFTNFGVLVGVNTPSGRYAGLLETDYGIAGSLELVKERFAAMQPRGWVVMLRSAANYEAARSLAMQPAQCQVGAADSEESLSSELKAAVETAKHATWAYLGCDLPALTSQSDDARLARKCFLPADSTKVEMVKSCSILGNDNLAFISLAGTFAAQTKTTPAPRTELSYSRWLNENAMGQQTVLAILRKQSGVWRLLAISDDSMDTNPSVYPTDTTLQRLAKLLTSAAGNTTLPTPAVLTTADGARVARLSQREFENFEWTPSAAPDVVGQVVEFLISDNVSPRELTRLFFFLGRENRLSSGYLMGLGGRWRVWSISRDGNVSLTEARTYTHR
jgi:hypothetical protein